METEKKRINCCGFRVAVLYDERLWRQQDDYFIFNLFSSLLWPLCLIYMLHLFKNECSINLALSTFLNIINFYYNISHIFATYEQITLYWYLCSENRRNCIIYEFNILLEKTCLWASKINNSKVCQVNFSLKLKIKTTWNEQPNIWSISNTKEKQLIYIWCKLYFFYLFSSKWHENSLCWFWNTCSMNW